MAKKKDTTEESIESLTAKMKPAEIRFLTLYLGGEDGKCWNNATLSYIVAYNIETSTKKDDKGKYSKAYIVAKSGGYELLTKPHIQKLRNFILLKQGYHPDNIKKRYTELQTQNKNPIVALQANDRMAKIVGIIDDNKKVNIPELESLGNAIRNILTPK